MTFVYELGGLLSRDSTYFYVDIQLKTPKPFADAAESLKMLKDDPKVCLIYLFPHEIFNEQYNFE